MVFEPLLLKEYSNTIEGWKARLRAMALPMLWIAIGSFLIYLFLLALIAGGICRYVFLSISEGE